MMSHLTLTPAVEYSFTELANLFNLAFTGYIGGTVNLNALSFGALIARENIHMVLSQVALLDGEPVGIGLIARRGWMSRLAGMGIIPNVQEQGLGTQFTQALVQQAQDRHDRAMTLEAFEANVRAVKAYQRVGFEVLRRLNGYHARELPAYPSDRLRQVDILEVAKRIVIEDTPDTPWQVSGTAFTRYSEPSRAYQLGNAYALVSNVTGTTIILNALFVEPSARGRGEASRLLRALSAEFPAKAWQVVAVCPEEWGGFFLKQGFELAPLNQVQMLMTWR